jgi:redox-sensing transcriptional repressor
MKSEKISTDNQPLDVICGVLNTSTKRIKTISSQALAAQFNLNSAQIRKDLGYFGEFGVRASVTTSPTCAITSRRYSVSRLRIASASSAPAASEQRSPTTTLRQIELHRCALFDNDRQKDRPPDLGDSRSPYTTLKIYEGDSREVDRRVSSSPSPKAAQEFSNQTMSVGIKAVLNFAPVSLDGATREEVKTVDLTTRWNRCHIFFPQPSERGTKGFLGNFLRRRCRSVQLGGFVTQVCFY